MNKNIAKATRFYLFRSKDLISTLIISIITVFGFEFIIYKGFFDNRGEKFITLLLWVLIIGLTMINANSMIIDLPVKDKLKNRIEFILSSGIDVKDLIKTYTFEMWRISAIVNWFLFFITYILYDFTRPSGVVLVYISSIALLYFIILYFNIISLINKNLKFFKNILFFVSSILIYLSGTFSHRILEFLYVNGLDLIHTIETINIIFIIIFACLSIYKLNKINNEKIINIKGSWS